MAQANGQGPGVWFGNFWGRGVGLIAGADPKGYAAERKPAVIHTFQSGSIQMFRRHRPSGQRLGSQQLEHLNAGVAKDPPDPISTKGGGQGIVVIYGGGAPLRTPLACAVRKP